MRLPGAGAGAALTPPRSPHPTPRYHRRAVVEKLGDPSAELEFVARVLELDAKNYHAWAHRQWALLTYGGALWDGELDFAAGLLQLDVRNNSAWNHRWFVVTREATPAPPAAASRELDFAFAAIVRAPNNESPWNYVRAYLRAAAYADAEAVAKVLAFCDALPDKTAHAKDCPHLFAMLADVHEAAATDDGRAKAAALHRHLATLDAVRRHYWEAKARENEGGARR